MIPNLNDYQMEKATHRGRHRVDVENAIIRRREKQFNHDALWNGTRHYFEHWQKANSKFEQWTSPRYYEDNNKLMNNIKTHKEKEVSLEVRREKLKKLYEEEQKSYEIELMMHKNRMILERPSKSRVDDIPTEVLKNVHTGMKNLEEERRRYEAEMKLYHQWRINNPIVKQYESRFRSKDLKFSWLDQQIEKRMQKEKEEAENLRILKERDEQLKKEKQKEEALKKYLEEKRQQLKKNLDQQIEELKQKQTLMDELRKEEEKELQRQILISELEENKKMIEKKRAERECVLFNLQQYKRKLKEKAIDVQENLKEDELFILKLKKLELEDIISDEIKRNEIKTGLDEFLEIVKQQKALEKQRQKSTEFLFDSEARVVFERQNEIWRQEENARKSLLTYVLNCVKKQMEDNVKKNKENQKQLLLEREDMTNKVEEYNKELQKLKEEEELKARQFKKDLIQDDVTVKTARKKMEESIKMKEINDELERIQKEEERLKQEIIRIQKNQSPRRYTRTKIF